MAFSYLAATTNVTSDSLAIPVAEIAGFNTFDKFNGVDANLAFSRFLHGFLGKVRKVLTDNEIFTLGLTLTKDLDDLATTNGDTVISVWTILYQRLIRFSESVKPLPVPTGGTSSGVGDFALTEIFPGIEKVANGSPVTADSVVIPISDISPYGSGDFASINMSAGQDNRNLFSSIILSSVDMASLRTATVQSAVTSKTINQPTVPTLAASLTQETNPTSGIDSDDLFGKAFVINQQISISIELKLNSDNNTHDVNYM